MTYYSCSKISSLETKYHQHFIEKRQGLLYIRISRLSYLKWSVKQEPTSTVMHFHSVNKVSGTVSSLFLQTLDRLTIMLPNNGQQSYFYNTAFSLRIRSMTFVIHSRPVFMRSMLCYNYGTMSVSVTCRWMSGFLCNIYAFTWLFSSCGNLCDKLLHHSYMLYSN